MTNFADEYKNQLNELKFDESTKNRMAECLTAKVANKGAVGAASEGAANIANAATTPNLGTNSKDVPNSPEKAAILNVSAARKHRLRHSWYKVAASVAVALVLLVGGTTAAVAAGIIPSPSTVFADIFFAAPAKTDVVDEIGYPIGVSCTSNGVTVTADAVIGDQQNYAVILSISKDDGSAFNLDGATTATGTHNPNVRKLSLGVANHDFTIDGVDTAAGGFYFYDADKSDNAIQMVWFIRAKVSDGSSVAGRAAHLHMEDLLRFDYSKDTGDVRTTLAEGKWDLSFEMNYKDTSLVFAEDLSTTFTMQEKTNFETGEAGAQSVHDVTISKAVVSYVGISVEYTVNDVNYDEYESAFFAHEDDDTYKIKTGINIYELPVVITLNDGTVLDYTDDLLVTWEKSSKGTVCVTKGNLFDRIIETGEIASITLGNTTIDMNTVTE